VVELCGGGSQDGAWEVGSTRSSFFPNKLHVHVFVHRVSATPCLHLSIAFLHVVSVHLFHPSHTAYRVAVIVIATTHQPALRPLRAHWISTSVGPRSRGRSTTTDLSLSHSVPPTHTFRDSLARSIQCPVAVGRTSHLAVPDLAAADAFSRIRIRTRFQAVSSSSSFVFCLPSSYALG
jgi:hypothetical protein